MYDLLEMTMNGVFLSRMSSRLMELVIVIVMMMMMKTEMRAMTEHSRDWKVKGSWR